jgi:DNA-binding CsgD family transcriptional regulator
MLYERSVLRDAGGRLVACEAHAATALSEIIAMAGSGEAAAGTRPIAVPLSTRDSNHYVAHVLPLACGARRRAGACYAAVAALFVQKAVLATPSPPEVIARLYNLTRSELRVLLVIVDVGGVPETARALGVAEATVKTHLHRVFGKTGACRQADLVKLVAGFCSPLFASPGCHGHSRPGPPRVCSMEAKDRRRHGRSPKEPHSRRSGRVAGRSAPGVSINIAGT